MFSYLHPGESMMAKPKEERMIKRPTMFLALLPIFTMVILLCLGYVLFECRPNR